MLETYLAKIQEVKNVCLLDAVKRHGCTSQVIEVLLKEGANIDCHDDNLDTALILACKANKIAIFKCLLKHNADMYATDRSGNTVLYYAVADGRLDFLESLYQNKCDINRKLPLFKTPLFIAVESNQFDIAKRLLEMGADMRGGRSPYERASALKKENFIRLFDEWTTKQAQKELDRIILPESNNIMVI